MAWSVLQSKSNSSASATTLAATYSTNLSAGSKLVAYVSSATKTIASVKDGAGNTFTQLTRSAQTNYNLYSFALDVPAADIGTTPTITATASGSDPGLAILIQEVAGLLPGNTVAMLDGTAGTNHGTDTTGSFSTGTPAYTSAVANEFTVALYGDDGTQGGTTGNTWVAPGGYTNDANSINTNAHVTLAVSYKNSTGGSESDGYSVSNAGGGFTTNWGIALFAFKLAVPGGGPPPTLIPPGLQSPMSLAVPARFSVPPPPVEQPAPAPELIPPGLQSPMSLGVPARAATQQAPAVPPASPWPTLPPTPPGLQSPSVLAEPPRFSIPPAPQQQPAGASQPIPPGLQSPMSLGVPARPATQPPPAPPPPAAPGFYQLTPPGRISPMSIGLGLYAPSPGPQTPPTPAAVVVTLALAGMLDRRPGYLKKRILFGI